MGAAARAASAHGEVCNGRIYARATDMAEIRARLVSLEQAHHVLRAEIRADIKELQQVIREHRVVAADDGGSGGLRDSESNC